MAKTSNTNGDSTSFDNINAGTVVKGDINSTGDIKIDGTLEGNLTSKGRLVIGASGFIKGTIQCNNANVFGKIEGKITVDELLSLKSSAKIFGDIFTDKLAVEPNAVFTGNCKMGEKPGAQTSGTSYSLNDSKQPTSEEPPKKK